MTTLRVLSRRVLLAAMAAGLAGGTARPQSTDGRPGLRRGERPGVDDALRRTVTLVLRAEARGGPLPAYITDPAPIDDALAATLRAGVPYPPDMEYVVVPDSMSRRLPHTRRGTIWVAVGTWMMEIDPVRRVVLLIAHDVLPPDI